MMAPVCLDPRTKLFIVLSISSLAVFLRETYLMAVVLCLSVGVTKALKADLAAIIKNMRKLLGIFVAIVILQSIFNNEGTAILNIMDISLITDMGLRRGIQTILRFLIIISSAAILTTSNSREIIQGLIQWRVPFELAFMVSVAIRFLPLLREEVSDMFTAIQLRGVNLKRIPLYKRLKTYSYLLMPMISSVLLKSQDLSVAMEMRAFRAFPGRTSFRVLHFTQADYLIMVLSAISFLLMIFIDTVII